MADNIEEQKNHKELIDRLKAEGQLTRNSGTNSLKSVRIEIEKFDEVFDAMRKKLRNQGESIADLVKIQEQSFELDKSQEQRILDAERLASVGGTPTGDGPSPTPSPSNDGEDAGKKAGAMWGAGLLMNIGPGLGAFIGGGLAGAAALLSGARLGGMLLRAIPLVTLAPLIGNFIGDFVGEGLKDLGADAEVTEQMRDTFNKAGRWGAMGAVFGRKGAAIGFFAGALSSFGASLIERFSIGEDQSLSILGIDVDALAASETILAALGGTLVLLAPSLMKLTGKLLLGALTGPVGIAALTGAALAGTAYLVNEWMENRRKEFIEELEDKTAEGFAAVDKIAEEKDISIFRRLALSLGASPETATEEFDQIRRSVDAAAQPTGMGDFGEAGSRLVIDTERRESLQRSLEHTLQNVTDLETLSRRNLLDIKSSAEMLQMSDLVNKIERSLENQSARERLTELLISRDELTQRMGVTENDPRVIELDVAMDDILQQIQENSYRLGSKGFQDFGKGTLSVLHGIEAVVPRRTPAGEVLATMFDENFQPKFDVNTTTLSPVLEQITNSALSNVVNNIVLAPTTVSPVTSISQGGSAVSSITNNAVTSFGGGGNGGSGLGRFAN